MSNFQRFGRKLAAIAATAATFCSTTGSNTLSQGSSTVATLIGTLYSRLSRLKNAFYSLFGSSSSSTSPNFAQEHDYSGISAALAENESDRFPDSWEGGDEFDHEDYDEWWENEGCEDFDGEFGDCDEVIEEYWEGSVYNIRRSWIGRAVDEAIEEENNGSIGDIPF